MVSPSTALPICIRATLELENSLMCLQFQGELMAGGTQKQMDTHIGFLFLMLNIDAQCVQHLACAAKSYLIPWS